VAETTRLGSGLQWSWPCDIISTLKTEYPSLIKRERKWKAWRLFGKRPPYQASNCLWAARGHGTSGLVSRRCFGSQMSQTAAATPFWQSRSLHERRIKCQSRKLAPQCRRPVTLRENPSSSGRRLSPSPDSFQFQRMVAVDRACILPPVPTNHGHSPRALTATRMLPSPPHLRRGEAARSVRQIRD
jgi:hypothetical protein